MTNYLIYKNEFDEYKILSGNETSSNEDYGPDNKFEAIEIIERDTCKQSVKPGVYIFCSSGLSNVIIRCVLKVTNECGYPFDTLDDAKLYETEEVFINNKISRDICDMVTSYEYEKLRQLKNALGLDE